MQTHRNVVSRHSARRRYMPRKPHGSFMFANARPVRPGSARGSRNKVAQIQLPPPAPDPKGLILDLKDLVGVDDVAAIKAAKQLVFHSVGDTGGVRDGAAQQTLIAE